ncbi:CAP domain-containing protein [Massariosphaeria phaeospora]|uniref:CAP domain-containing protein n=1 Tax=Massariosphaeria phaeospora TaxID=100035 RepID=A0A7C8HYM0_9PLEO|nr:CAP domain-containing protein [Massariosphaeria phaeospora]
MKNYVLLALAATRAVYGVPAELMRRQQVDDAAPKITDQKFISTIIDAHWYWRKIHCAQDLRWDPALAQAALESVSACTRKPQHDRGGSNLSCVGPAPENYDQWIEFARTVVHGWHEEETKYPYDNPSYADAWGHFTQMVWRDTSRIGCALGHCKDHGDSNSWPGRLYCFYENAGNNIAQGEFEKQVWRPICPDPTLGQMQAALGHT